MIDPAVREKLLEHLRANSVVSYACAKAGVSRATYYRWLEDDPDFAEAAGAAAKLGRSAVCDMAESAVLAAIRRGDVGAAKFVLARCHPEYVPRKPRDPEELTFEPIQSVLINEIPPNCPCGRRRCG